MEDVHENIAYQMIRCDAMTFFAIHVKCPKLQHNDRVGRLLVHPITPLQITSRRGLSKMKAGRGSGVGSPYRGRRKWRAEPLADILAWHQLRQLSPLCL